MEAEPIGFMGIPDRCSGSHELGTKLFSFFFRDGRVSFFESRRVIDNLRISSEGNKEVPVVPHESPKP